MPSSSTAENIALVIMTIINVSMSMWLSYQVGKDHGNYDKLDEVNRDLRNIKGKLEKLDELQESQTDIINMLSDIKDRLPVKDKDSDSDDS
jgi:regulatory protein YycH of two-component signal transduction system YycFG